MFIRRMLKIDKMIDLYLRLMYICNRFSLSKFFLNLKGTITFVAFCTCVPLLFAKIQDLPFFVSELMDKVYN